MKNKLGFLAVLVIGLALILGCGVSEKIQKAVEGDKSSKSGSSDNKSLEDKAIDSAFNETTGVPECDEVLSTINDQMKSKDDNWASKAIKGYAFDQIKKSIKESVEKNKNDKVKIAEQCKDFKKQVDKALAEEKEKKQ